LASWHNHKLLPLSCRIFEFWLHKSRVLTSILEIPGGRIVLKHIQTYAIDPQFFY